MGLSRRAMATAVGLAVAMIVTACSGGGSAGGGSLTLYNAQHEDLVKAMVDGFTKETGIKVNIRSGKDFELANHIVQEGGGSAAAVFVTENSPAMSLVDGKGLLAKLDDTPLAQIPGQFVPSSRNWIG